MESLLQQYKIILWLLFITFHYSFLYIMKFIFLFVMSNRMIYCMFTGVSYQTKSQPTQRRYS
jgi:hypothetical protein